jgi:hypothetical protein
MKKIIFLGYTGKKMSPRWGFVLFSNASFYQNTALSGLLPNFTYFFSSAK